MTGIPAIEPYPLTAAGRPCANTADWTLAPHRAVLLVHDMQRYFVAPLPHALRTGVVRNAASLRAYSSARGIPVAYTAQPGGMTTQQRGLLDDFWGPGMLTTPADRQIVDELAPAPGDRVFTKWRYSAFFRSRLLQWMREQGRDQLILCGVYAHIGVLTTAVEAFTHDIQTFLVTDAVADFSAEHHRMAVEYAAQRCAMVVSTREVVA